MHKTNFHLHYISDCIFFLLYDDDWHFVKQSVKKPSLFRCIYKEFNILMISL